MVTRAVDIGGGVHDAPPIDGQDSGCSFPEGFRLRHVLKDVEKDDGIERVMLERQRLYSVALQVKRVTAVQGAPPVYPSITGQTLSARGE